MSTDREEFLKSLRVENINDNKPKIKNKPNRVRWIAGIMAALSISMAATSCRANNNSQEIEDNVPAYEETEIEDNNTISQEDLIKTVEDVEKDFIERYLEAYNEKYGTNYKTGELNVRDIGYAYQVQTSFGETYYATHGSRPYETKAYLEKYGKLNGVDCEHVLQILVGEKVLGTYNMDLGEIKLGQFLESGNQLDSNLENYNLQELVDLTLANLASDVKLAEGAESKESINLRIERYKSRINELDRTEKEEGIEIGD